MWFVHKVSNLIWPWWFSNPLVHHLIPHVMAKLSMFFGKYAGTFRHTHRYMELIVLRSYATCTYYIVLVYRTDTLYESIWFHTWYSHTKNIPTATFVMSSLAGCALLGNRVVGWVPWRIWRRAWNPFHSWGMLQKKWVYPLVNYHSTWKWWFIVDFPIKKWWIFPLLC